jgi:GT2 family glycosyltransferase
MQFSVIIPTCHRNDLLAKCLDCLAPGQQAGAQIDWESRNVGTDNAKSGHGILVGESPDLAYFSYEVIVSDDGRISTAKHMIAERYPWARWLEGPRSGPAANRNNGARNANGEWLLFVDDDCLPDVGWLSATAMEVSKGNVDVIEGRTITPDKVDNPFWQGVENLNGGCYWSCNLAVSRAAFLLIGGFDEDFLEAAGEDMEFGFRFRKRGLRPRFSPSMVVLHPVRQMSFRRMIWWTRTARWMTLYYLKTGSGPPLRAGVLRSAIWLARTRIMSLLRSTWRSFRRFDRTSWKTTLFWKLWEWLTLPIVLPYMIVWDRRFRNMLIARDHQSPSLPSLHSNPGP